MTSLGKLTFLCVTSLLAQQICSQQAPDQGNQDYNYEQISKILQAPLFRENPTGEDAPSYLPHKYNGNPLKQSNEETKTSESFESPIPSLILQAPSANAPDTYVSHKSFTDNIQGFPIFQPQPLSKFMPNNHGSPPASPPQPVYLVNLKPKYSHQSPLVQAYIPLNPVSKQLDLPLPDNPVQNFTYPSIPSSELQTPHFGPYNNQFNPNIRQYFGPPAGVYYTEKNPQEAKETPYKIISQSLENPKSESIKPLSNPTGQFPKKYSPNSDKSAPKKAGKDIPVIEFVGDKKVEGGKFKKGPVKPQKLIHKPNNEQFEDEGTLDSYLRNIAQEKQRRKFEDSQKKIQFKKENELKKQQQHIDATILRASIAKNEPVASETGFNNYRHGEAISFASPAHHSAGVGLGDVGHGGDGDRTEFQMHGQQGPHSYKFGFDTGKGKNRQFRYEERNKEGHVKGHYGYYDKEGKLQVVNYDAHPHHGFHAEGSFGKV